MCNPRRRREWTILAKSIADQLRELGLAKESATAKGNPPPIKTQPPQKKNSSGRSHPPLPRGPLKGSVSPATGSGTHKVEGWHVPRMNPQRTPAGDAMRALRVAICACSQGTPPLPEELDALVDAVADHGRHFDSAEDIVALTETINRWVGDAIEDPAVCVHLRRLLVFRAHRWVYSIFVRSLARYCARVSLGQFVGENRWAVWATDLRRSLPEFRDVYSSALGSLWCEIPPLTTETARKAMLDHIGKIRSARLPVKFATSDPEESDLALCAVWAGKDARSAMGIRSLQELQESITKREANRLLSARLAEKVTSAFYEALGYTLRDTSIDQLTGSSTRWKSHDSEADGVPLDVKNARRSFSSPSSYSEWCINAYKVINRKNGAHEDVRLVGVLSDYIPEAQLEAQLGRSRVTVLGETTKSRMAQVSQWASTMTGGRLSMFQDPYDSRFLAGWCFDYPDRYYEDHAAVDKMPGLINDLVATGSPLPVLPLIFRLLSGRAPLEADPPLIRLSALRKEVGFTRLSAVAFGLVELVLAVQGEKTARPGDLQHALFPDGNFPQATHYGHTSQLEGLSLPMQHFPLLRYDPERQVACMMNSISRVWSSCRSHLAQFRRFRLSGAGIFQGAESGGPWVTIFAYCGGWKRDPITVRCGNSPLLMGTHDTCQSCSRLICDKCGYCAKECADCDARQEAMAGAGAEWRNSHDEDRWDDR
jgi:hypothetical protein